MKLKNRKKKNKSKFSRIIHKLVKAVKFIFDFLQLLKSIMEFFH